MIFDNEVFLILLCSLIICCNNSHNFTNSNIQYDITLTVLLFQHLLSISGTAFELTRVYMEHFSVCKLNDCDLCFQAHNAKQLSRWCLHFIATNFSVFESTEEFDLVQGDNRDYVTEHRWPPLSYLKAQEEFEKKVKSSKFNSSKFNSSKCNIM